MKIEEAIERSGYFWRAGRDEYKAPGILRISDDEGISLEIVGSFSGPTGSIEDLDEDMSIGRIIGNVEKAGFVTLENCIFRQLPYAFGGIIKSQIAVNWAIFGVAFDPSEEILFDTFSASIEGLDKWLGISGISSELSDDFKSLAIHYKQPDFLKLIENDNLSITIQFSYAIPPKTTAAEATVRQSTFLQVSTTELQKPEFFMTVFRKLREFLSFATDETVSLYNVSAKNTAITVEIAEGKSKPVNMDIYYGTINHMDTRPNLKFRSMLFRYDDISKNPERILSSWLLLYDKIDSAMHLYFATKAGAHRYIEGQFLSLTQTLETLHRRTSSETIMSPEQFEEVLKTLTEACPKEHDEWLMQRLTYGNEIGLTRRVKRLLEPFSKQFGTKIQRKKLARLITDTRNYLTHYDKKLFSKAAKERDLWVASQKMEALLQLHLLKTLNFSDEQITTICCSSSRAIFRKIELQFGKQ